MHIHCAQCNVLSAMCIVHLQSEFKIQFINSCNVVDVDIDGHRTRPSSDSEAATMYKLKGKSSNMRTGQGFK